VTWGDLVEIAAVAIKRELPALPEPRARITAQAVATDLRIELAKRKWKGPLGDNEAAFYGNFEKAKR